jgi:hypothetical protein
MTWYRTRWILPLPRWIPPQGSRDHDVEEFGDPAGPGIIHANDLAGKEPWVRRLVRTSPVSPPLAERGLSYEEILAKTSALRRAGGVRIKRIWSQHPAALDSIENRLPIIVAAEEDPELVELLRIKKAI